MALYADLNNLDPEQRPGLQKHMEDWSAQSVADPAPDAATIRKKLSDLYSALNRRNGARN